MSKQANLYLLLDGPVVYFCPLDELRAWIDQLKTMRPDYVDSPQALEAIDRNLEEAEASLRERTTTS